MTLVSIFLVQKYETMPTIWLLFKTAKQTKGMFGGGPYFYIFIPLLLTRCSLPERQIPAFSMAVLWKTG